jgi:hypothetical protein
MRMLLDDGEFSFSFFLFLDHGMADALLPTM